MLLEHLQSRLDDISARGQTRALRQALSPTGVRQRVAGPDGEAREVMTFCSNDYLGLAGHPAIAAGLAEGVRRWGGGAGASHLISGHTEAHEQFEQALAKWYAPHIPGAQCLGFSTGYMANLAVTTALGDACAELFSDELNHASLIDGMRLAKAKVHRYAHGDLINLRALLGHSQAAVKLIVTDTVFSMDGDMAPVPELLKLAEEFDAWLILDDAHGFGVLGLRGRGTLEHFGLNSQRIILLGTLGKAAGLSGAFVAAHPTVIQYLLQVARPYIYTTASLPAVNHAMLASLDLIECEEGRQRRTRLQSLQDRLREGVSAMLKAHPHLGWYLMPSLTPIQPLVVGSNAVAMSLAASLDAAGLRVPGIRPPTVAEGQARLRITLSANHTGADVDRLVNALQHLACGTERPL